MSAKLAAWLGYDGLAQFIDRSQALTDSRLLDGLLSIWHADSSQ
jgi:hypothetical protein